MHAHFTLIDTLGFGLVGWRCSVVSVVQGIQDRVAGDADFSVLVSLTDDVDDALGVAAQADVLVMCGGTTSREGQDRRSLLLDQDDFISSIATQTEVSVARVSRCRL